MASAEPDLTGLRVLVVEDSLLVADLIGDALRDSGCDVVGPASRLMQGLALATVEQLDGALLDVNLGGERCFPIAAALRTRGIPFAFLTGYGDAALPSEYRNAPRLTKPFRIASLMAIVAATFAKTIHVRPGPGSIRRADLSD
jgi:DNA-binding response OmpR family regulator